MNKPFYILTVGGFILILSACSWPSSNQSVTSPGSPLSLQVQVQNSTEAFDAVGDTIQYTYIVTNTGSESLARPFEVTDNLTTVECPGVRTVGNLDTALDPGERLLCTGTYSLTQADLAAGSITNVATASAAGGSILSPTAGVTVNLTAVTPGKALGLAKTANPSTYNQVGQVITYNYVITNTGSLAIGPTQFAITDNRISGPFPCGAASTTLNPGQTVTCTANYTITQQDMGVNAVTNSAIASGGDAQASSPASATITNSLFQGNVTPSITPGPSNLTPGTTIQHQVVKGEWMIQIARCYGVAYESLRNANRHIPVPSFIEPGQVLTVPNIGSAGTIFGPPCVVFHTVASGDTWDSIATRYNARVDVLREANPSGLVVSTQIKVPINSARAGAAQVPVTGVTSTYTATPTFTATPTPTPTFTATVTSPVITMVSNTPTVTPTLGTAAPGTGQLNRITFPSGVSTLPISGVLIGHETVSYIVSATQGQTLTVSLAAPVNEIALRIMNPSGIFIKQLDGNLIWTGPLQATGDYRIDLVGLTDPSKNYTLTVGLTGP